MHDISVFQLGKCASLKGRAVKFDIIILINIFDETIS